MRKALVFGFAVCITLVSLGQQRAITSTYSYNQLLLNPAYAGSLNVLSVIAVHRKQWINVDGAPTFSALSAHSSFMGNQVGGGFFVSRDKTGPHTMYSLYGSYAYKIKTPLGILAMGIQGGFDDRKIDYGELNLLDPDDPLFTASDRRFTPNFGTGLYFANPYMYAGFSVPYILENRTVIIDEDDLNSNEESRESRYYYVTGGVVFPIGPNMKLSPGILLRGQEDARFAWDINANLIFDEIAYLGINVRNSGDLTFFGQVILNENFRVGYAYDATTSELNNQSAGTHEILLNYRIKLKNYRKDPQCPVYF